MVRNDEIPRNAKFARRAEQKVPRNMGAKGQGYLQEKSKVKNLDFNKKI